MSRPPHDAPLKPSLARPARDTSWLIPVNARKVSGTKEAHASQSK